MTNVGIIGIGRSGWELHAAHLSIMSNYRVSAVCDQSASRAKEASTAFGAKAYTDPHKLLADDDVRLVVVSVPVHLHADLAVAAMKAGKDVVVEKPMANTLAEADEMLATARVTGRLLTVFHNRRWDRDYQMLKSMVEQDVLGPLLTLDSRVMTYGPEWTNYGVPEFDPQWRLRAAYGGGFLADWGPHLVDQCIDLTGEMPVDVMCEMRSHLWATEVEDYFHLRLTFPSGLLVTVEGSNNARIPLPRWFVVGCKASLIADGVWGRWTDMKLRGAIGDMSVDMVPHDVGPSSGGRNYDVGTELSAQFYGDLADALATGRDPAITAVHARNVISVLEAARESNSTAQTVKIAV